MFLSSCRYTRVSLEEREMLWECELQVSASTASPKLSWVFLKLDRNANIIFSITFRKYNSAKKKNQLAYFGHQNVNSLCSHHHYINSSCYVVLCCYRVKPRPNDHMSMPHIAWTLLGATCCVHLATLLDHVATCSLLLAQIWPSSNLSQQHSTCRNRAARCTQHVAPNNVVICCPDMLRSFGQGFIEKLF